ncbi:HAD family hydrolase [Saccharopolyspora elongata]|uniref:HAD family hydrolase n=1 Tax=Saccharopolyspora elongata TaxID=2530387 RepID=A0A4R4YZQ9_9PSEU|nr:HAD-IA family hydrolase [Saccharopolyspora elongata]TDD50946.1 HAD family hydrolase [Saccharopolyspora elongata]
MPEKEFDAILCDLDGVIRWWDPEIMSGLDRANGLPRGTLAKTAFAPDRLNPAITGARTDEQWRAAIAADLAEACGSPEAARALVAEWAAHAGEVVEEVAELLAAAREHVPVVLVSNATTRLESDLARLGIADLLDEVVNSARVGIAKPDPGIFRFAATRAGVPEARCLFVDDTLQNVEAARGLGMRALHHQNPAQLREILAPLLSRARE